jgi:hypothetical protein
MRDETAWVRRLKCEKLEGTRQTFSLKVFTEKVRETESDGRAERMFAELGEGSGDVLQLAAKEQPSKRKNPV